MCSRSNIAAVCREREEDCGRGGEVRGVGGGGEDVGEKVYCYLTF